MNTLLNQLNIRKEVQVFFQNDFTVGPRGDLIFHYGIDAEYYGSEGHQIPLSQELWIAGNKNFHLVRQVFICSSALEAMAFFSLQYYSFVHKDYLLFIATGIRPNNAQYQILREFVRKRKVALVMGNDFFGRVCDLKVATGLKEKALKLFMMNENQIMVHLPGKEFQFDQCCLTLNALEKASGLRSGIRTFKPKNSLSFFQQLKRESEN